ncbi:MAG: integrin alpha, partial [Pseudomonadota bacterium]
MTPTTAFRLLTVVVGMAAAAASADPQPFNDPALPKPYSTGEDAARERDGADKFFVEDDADVLLTLTGEQPGDGFGWVAEGLGDINGDGAGDFIVTAPFFSTNLQSAGKFYVYSGADGALLNSVTSPGVPLLGYSAKDAGDVDGDG